MTLNPLLLARHIRAATPRSAAQKNADMGITIGMALGLIAGFLLGWVAHG